MELHAPPHWHSVDLISDLHLQLQEPETFRAWQGYLERTSAQAVFMLGDIFEVWVGDDAAAQTHSFEAQCAASIRAAAQRTSVFLMHGNRDFLMGSAFASSCNATLLPDPTTLVFGEERTLLTHGDALCLDDVAYQQFRTQVRSDAWKRNFLSKPLEERQAIARDLRKQSMQAQGQRRGTHVDVDTAATRALILDQQAGRIVHGHTHRPAEHVLDGGVIRWVLTDWDLAATPPRAQVLRLSKSQTGGVNVGRLPLDSPFI